MTFDYNFVVFGEDWGAHPSSTQHIFKKISQDHSVHWINSIGLRRPQLSIKDLGRCVQKLVNKFGSQKRVNTVKTSHKNINIINPLAIPVPQNKWERNINKTLLSGLVSQGFEKEQVKNILWTSLPTAVDGIGHRSEDISIYYCCDDFSSLAGVDHEDVTKMEKELSDKVDIIIVSNPLLLKKFTNKKTYYVPHGVDYDLFSKHSKSIETKNRIAGFYGAIHDWLDIDLIYKSAKHLADWSFVMIGPVHTDIKKLENLPNVTLLGEKPHHELPLYLSQWDIAMLPFKNCDQIMKCNPLKLREYMASNASVLSTDFPAARDYEDHINIATTPDEFVQSFEKILIERDLEKIKKRQELMKSESWQARADTITDIIHDFLTST